jgi:ubiquinone biosynthesis protein Coq4
MSQTYAYPNRVQNPLRVARAFGRVLGDLSRTEDAAIVQVAFARSRWGSRFARWDEVARKLAREPRIERVLAQRGRLGWIDLESLVRLPEGSLGRCFAEHMALREINPNLVEPLPAEDPGSFVLAHFGETHDIWHVVTGYGNDELGEVSLIGFYAAQFEGAPHFALLLGILFLNTAFSRPGEFRARLDALALGWEAGKSAESLFGRDWANAWARPIREVRAELGLREEPIVAGEGLRAAA